MSRVSYFLLILLCSCKASNVIVRKILSDGEIRTLYQFNIPCDLKRYQYTSAERYQTNLALSEQEQTTLPDVFLDNNGKLTSKVTDIRVIRQQKPGHPILLDFEIVGIKVFNGIKKSRLALQRDAGTHLIKIFNESDLAQFTFEFLPFDAAKLPKGLGQSMSESDKNVLAQTILHSVEFEGMIEVAENLKDPRICADTAGKSCLVPYEGPEELLSWDAKTKRFRQAWQIKFYNGSINYPYKAVVAAPDSENSRYDVVSFSPYFLDLEGKAWVYPSRDAPTSKEVVEVTLPNMQDGPYLCSDWYVTLIPSTVSAAHDRNHEYRYDTSSAEFREVSVFAHLSQFEEWLASIGFVRWTNTPIVLDLYSQYDPQYVNPDLSVSGPGRIAKEINMEAILLPNTLRTSLSGLHLSPDAAVHERAHGVHIEYVAIGTTFQQHALVEALADAPMYLFTGDGCLGEDICQPGNTLCVKDKCLRSAETGMKYGDAQYCDYYSRGQHHRAGQIVAEFFWDLHAKAGIERDRVAKLVLATLKRMQSTTDFEDFVGAVRAAEAKDFRGEFSSKVEAMLKQVGLDGDLATPVCN